MHKTTLNLLVCPACRCAFDVQSVEADEHRVTAAVLTCPACQLSTPVVEGFPLFGETRPRGEGDPETWLSTFEELISGNDDNYLKFIKEKSERGHLDTYAAFQPFNESTRALYPFLELLAEHLAPGDVILDTWCRTGWSGELLASLFPQQQVISIWEGNSNVLGYRGFSHWLGEGQRAENLDILFTHPDHALPLADDSVNVVHGLDSLHRYRHASFIPECLRVSRDDGVLIFPHIHLTNSQPEPFFERGCQQYHGREWKAWLDRALKDSGRAAWILPEAGLFEAKQEFALADQSVTDHYNALVLIANETYNGRKIRPRSHPEISGESRFLANPMIKLSLDQCRVAPDPGSLAGYAAEMLDRHPCYRDRLDRCVGATLTVEEALLAWHLRTGATLRSAALEAQLPLAGATEIALRLCRRELFHPAAVSRSMARLQNFYAFVELPESRPAHFSALWPEALERYGDGCMLHWLEDASELQAGEAAYLVDAIRARFQAVPLPAGSRILISSRHHPEALLVCWAAWLQGMVTVIVDPALPPHEIERLQRQSACAFCFTDDADLLRVLTTASVCLDGEGAPAEASFSTWLENSLESEPPSPETDPAAAAVVLFTSGSTGMPKGVVLSQRALCNSGWTMADTHGWNGEVLLSLGPLSMMSGLRNPAVAALVSGSRILVPGQETVRMPLNAWQQAAAQGVSVITAVPAWLTGILGIASRLEPAPALKQVLLTGTSLGAGLQAEARDKLGVLIGDYYGLTETGGICTAATRETETGTLGHPVEALLHILDEQGEPVGETETGRLRVHSRQLMSGYLDDPESTSRVLRDGWLYTGDLAHWDESGCLVLDGREDELLKLRNGMRFHPLELEAVLTTLAEVDFAAVTVLADSGDIVALVVSSADPASIRQNLCGLVPEHLLPARVINVPELPVNSNGKLVRAEVANIFRKLS